MGFYFPPLLANHSTTANALSFTAEKRFHLPNGSSIDSLLNKDDVSLEAILDEDDLLQECKAQNTRLIDYFQRIDVLHRLMGYVTGQIGGEENGSFKLRPSLRILVPLLLAELDELAPDTPMSPPKCYAARSGQSSRLASNTPTSSSFHSGKPS